MSSIEEVKAKLLAAHSEMGGSRASMAQVAHDLQRQIAALLSATEGSEDSDMRGAIAALQAELGQVEHTSAVVGKTMEETERYVRRI